MFIDFHTHILPGIDDGARDVNMSLKMLSTLQKQGVGVVAVTPHLYWHRQPLSEFILNRQEALNVLLANQYEGMPIIVPGAEVYIEHGIRYEDVRPLCYADTNYILLELPYSNYQNWFLEEVYHLCLTRSVIPVFAHLDRYIDMYSENAMEEILDYQDAVIQINQEAILDGEHRNTVLKWIKEGRPVVFGSDCHDLKYRTSRELCLQAILKSKLGKDWLEDYEKFTLNLIGKSK